jgi:hypothetical protein
MIDNHKTTPEQWDELLARVEALEAQASNYPAIPDSSTPPPVATDEELRDIWDRAFDLRAIYNLGVAHGQAGSREVADPAPAVEGLEERVKFAIDSALYDEDDHQWNEARAAIFEAAKWLREQGLIIDADLLEQEAGR